MEKKIKKKTDNILAYGLNQCFQSSLIHISIHSDHIIVYNGITSLNFFFKKKRRL